MKRKTLADNIITLIFLTVVLKLVGFVSRSTTAFWFGTDSITDIYYTATGFVDSISTVMLSGMTVGIINIYLSRDNIGFRNDFISNLLSITVGLMCIFSFVCLLFAEKLSILLISECTQDVRNKLVGVLRILCVSFPIQGIISILGAVLQAEKQFTVVKLTGTITSLTNIVCVMILAESTGINALVTSYVAGTVLNSLFLFFCTRKRCTIRIGRIVWNENIKQLVIMACPLMLSMAAHQINLIIDKSIASRVAVGAISALSYSSFLYLCVENIIIQSVATAIFPEIAEVGGKDNRKIAIKVNNTLVFTISLLLPIVVCTLFHAEFIVEIVYMRGNFSNESLTLTTSALQGYMLGLPILALRDVITRVFYASGDTRTPMIVGLISVAINIVLDIILSKCIGIFGITFATSIANSIAGILLYLQVRKCNPHIINKHVRKEIFALLCSATVIVLANHGIIQLCNRWLAFFTSVVASYFAVIAMSFILRSQLMNQIRKVLMKIERKNEYG